MYCGECGAALSAGDRFCQGCGSLTGGEVEGRFEVKGLVGRAESGVAFLVYDQVLDRLVLMRELSPGLLDDPERLSRLQTTVSAVAGIADVNCVQVFSLDLHAVPPLLFTEWVPGPSVRRLISEEGVDPFGAAAVLEGALSGLGRMHQLGVAHGFLTPSRVLLDRHGQSKVADVGMGLGVHLPTEALMFLAPEVLTAPERVPDQRADVFAAGALLAALLSSRAPFPCSGLTQALEVRRSEPVGLEDMPGPIADLVVKSTAFEPSDRPSSAEEFRTELHQAAQAALGSAWLAIGTAALAATAVGVGSASVVAATATSATAVGSAAAAAGAGTAATGSAATGTAAAAATTAAGSGAGSTGTGVVATIAAKPLLAAGVALGTAAAVGGGGYAIAQNQQPRWTATSEFENMDFTLKVPSNCVTPYDTGQIVDGAQVLEPIEVKMRDGKARIPVNDGVTFVESLGAYRGRFGGGSPEYSVLGYRCYVGADLRLAEFAVFDGSGLQVPVSPNSALEALPTVQAGTPNSHAGVVSWNEKMSIVQGRPTLEGDWSFYLTPFSVRADVTLGRNAHGDLVQSVKSEIRSR